MEYYIPYYRSKSTQYIGYLHQQPRQTTHKRHVLLEICQSGSYPVKNNADKLCLFIRGNWKIYKTFPNEPRRFEKVI